MMIPLNHLVIFSQMHRHLDSFCLYLFISIVIDIGCFNDASDHGCFSVEHARAWPQNWMLFFSSETGMPGHQVNLESMRMVLYICPWWSAIVFQNHRDLFLWLRSLQFYLSSTLLIQPFRLGPGISCQAWPIPAGVFWLGRCSIVFFCMFLLSHCHPWNFGFTWAVFKTPVDDCRELCCPDWRFHGGTPKWILYDGKILLNIILIRLLGRSTEEYRRATEGFENWHGYFTRVSEQSSDTEQYHP